MGKIRPIMVKGHERALTMIKYNREGDLLFSCSKDHVPSCWYSENGERVGTYHGHCGTVWCLDVNFDTTRLLTGSADNCCKLWDVKTGECLHTWKHTVRLPRLRALPACCHRRARAPLPHRGDADAHRMHAGAGALRGLRSGR